MTLGEGLSLLCLLTGWAYGNVGRRQGVSVDWTEAEVEVSHSTFLSLFQLSSSLTILPSACYNIGRTTNGRGYESGRPYLYR